MKGILIGSLALLLAGCAAPTNTACICDVAKLNNGWCSQCALGYVAGVTIESEMLSQVGRRLPLKSQASSLPSRARAPGGEQGQQIEDADIAVVVEVGRSAGVAAPRG